MRLDRRSFLAAPALLWLAGATSPQARERALPFPITAHRPGWRVSLFAALPRGIRLMEEDGEGGVIVSGYRRGNILRISPKGNVRELIRGLRLPHGLQRDGDWLYVAEEHRVVRFRYDPRGLRGSGEVVLSGIPTGGHVSRTVRKGPDGFFYLSVGSSCNVCIEDHPFRAAITRFHPGETPEVFARGLRNSVGFDWRPEEGVMYAVNAGSDMMGDDLPREELNRVERGRHYGWPYIHETNHRDPRFWDLRPKGITFTPPVHLFTAHSTPLSIRFLRRQPDVKPGSVAIVPRHGSWNRSTKSGYDVLWVDFHEDGTITHRPFLTGFLRGQKTLGRPVDVIERQDGTLLISDDYTGYIYQVSRT